MNKQEVYNRVRDHLLQQNKRCLMIGAASCAYRNADGLSCAIGGLICNELIVKYDLAARIIPAYHPDVMSALNEAGVDCDFYSLNDREFLSELQILHDQTSPDLWQVALTEFAKKNNLAP